MTSAEIAAARLRLPAAFGPGPLARAARLAAWALFAAWLVALFWWFDITPARLARGLSGLLVILRQMVPPSPGTQWADILQGLGQSVAMAFLGTATAAVVALPLGFLGARNVVVNALAHFSIRRVFDGFRGMDQLVWALAFVRAVGLGPLAGVLAIAAAEVCVLAKLFAEAIETAEPRQAESVTAADRTRVQGGSDAAMNVSAAIGAAGSGPLLAIIGFGGLNALSAAIVLAAVPLVAGAHRQVARDRPLG